MRLLLLLLVAAAFSGCLSDDDPAPVDDPNTPIDESDPDAPIPTEYSCTVDVGVPVVSLSGPANVGGCNLTTLTSDSMVVELTPAASCTIQYDMDNDGLSDGMVEVGATYASGTDLVVFCDPPATNAENSISLIRA